MLRLNSIKTNFKALIISLLFLLGLSLFCFSQSSRDDSYTPYQTGNRNYSPSRGNRIYQKEPGDEYLIKDDFLAHEVKDEKKVRERLEKVTGKMGKVILIIGGIAIFLGIYSLQSRWR